MGLADLFGSVANIYSKLKTGVSEVYNFGKNIVHKARGGFDWIDEQLDKASSIPFIGEAIQEGIDEARETQIFGFSWNRLKRGIEHIDNLVQHSEIEAYSQVLDNIITKGLEAGQKYGGELDQMFSGQAQTQGGIQV